VFDFAAFVSRAQHALRSTARYLHVAAALFYRVARALPFITNSFRKKQPKKRKVISLERAKTACSEYLTLKTILIVRIGAGLRFE
jgi:hypothetical protein